MSRATFIGRTNSNSYGIAHRNARKQEKRLAKAGNGRQTAGSGNKHEKGDVKKYNGLFRIEAKTTSRTSYPIKPQMLQELANIAMPCGEKPVYVLEFITPGGKVLSSLAVMLLSDFHEITENSNADS